MDITVIKSINEVGFGKLIEHLEEGKREHSEKSNDVFLPDKKTSE
jgi:hypothetical protein